MFNKITKAIAITTIGFSSQAFASMGYTPTLISDCTHQVEEVSTRTGNPKIIGNYIVNLRFVSRVTSFVNDRMYLQIVLNGHEHTIRVLNTTEFIARYKLCA